MAIYFCTIKNISRGNGGNAVSAAAYRAGATLFCQRTHRTFNFLKKEDVVHSEILLPVCAPKPFLNRDVLWNAVEKAEVRINSRVAKEVLLALPRELSFEKQKILVLSFVKEQFVRQGLCADVAIHNNVENTNPHAHILLTTREVNALGFTCKYDHGNKKTFIFKTRSEWADWLNCSLAHAGLDVRVDHRSYVVRGIDIEPSIKLRHVNDNTLLAQLLKERHQAIKKRNGQRLLNNPDLAIDILTYSETSFTYHRLDEFLTTYTENNEQRKHVLDKILHSPLLIYLGKDCNNKRRFTSWRLLKIEQQMFHDAMVMQQSGPAAFPVLVDQYTHLTKAEKHVLYEAIKGSGIVCLTGLSNIKKHHFGTLIRQLYERSGYYITGMALSNHMADTMKYEMGVEKVTTLSVRLAAWEHRDDLPQKKEILLLDEASVVGTRHMAGLLSQYRAAEGKIILLGDAHYQHHPVEARAAFRGIVERIGHIGFENVGHHEQTWQCQASTYLGRRAIRRALNVYDQKDCVHALKNMDAAIEALVDAYFQKNKGMVSVGHGGGISLC